MRFMLMLMIALFTLASTSQVLAAKDFGLSAVDIAGVVYKDKKKGEEEEPEPDCD